MIQVTKPFFPPVEEYKELIDSIWQSGWITNNGPLLKQLEKELESYLDVKNLSFVTNGTIALQIAIKALGLKGEIITTPFSYVATSSSIVWENCMPVFADIDAETFNIDPENIRKKITSKTTGIIATHVFGNPCHIDEIKKIADEHNLKVIYDAAHCFGSKYKGKSVFGYGDISTASFHATKVYHTTEGGAVVTKNESLKKEIDHMRNFGHNGPYKFHGIGINGKSSEFHAAMGLLNLRYIDEILNRRKQQNLLYTKLLSGHGLKFQKVEKLSEINFSYFPIVFKDEKTLLKTDKELRNHDIYGRRYFYPSLNTLSYLKGECPISEDIARRIFCLPLFYDLEKSDQEKISQIVLEHEDFS